MPLMPLTTIRSSSTATTPTRIDNHPHPLRSHRSAEDLVAPYRPQKQALSPTFSILRRDDHGRPGSRSARSSRSGASSFQVPPPSPSQTLGFSAAQGLGDGAWAGASIGEVPPLTKQTLRPKVSFSTFSQISIFSADEPILDAQGKERKAFYSNVVIEEDERRFDWRFFACVAVLGLVNFACDFSATALSTALPTVSLDLGLTAVQTFWIPGSLLLSAALVQPLFMRLGVALGCKSLLLVGISFFIAGSIIAACSKSFALLISGRCIEGIGAGAVSVLTQLALTQLGRSDGSHPADREQIFKRAASHMFWLGIAVGPIAGGACAQGIGWRNVFWIQLPFGVLGLCSLPFLLRLDYIESGPVRNKLLRIDILGWILVSGSIASICVAIAWGGVQYAWSSRHVLLPLLVGVLCISFWCFYNRYRLEAIVPINLFRHPNAAAACFGSFAQGLLLASVIYFMPIFFQVQGLGEVVSGILLAPWTFSIVAFGVLSGMVCHLLGEYRLAIWAGWAFATLGAGLMMLFGEMSSAAVCASIGLVGGIALGILLPVQSTAIEATAAADDLPHAAPISINLTTLGQCFGVLAGSSIFLNRVQAEIVRNSYSASTVQQAMSLLVDPLPDQAFDLVLATIYAAALRPVWITICTLAGLALFLNFWFLEDHTPPRNPSLPELE